MLSEVKTEEFNQINNGEIEILVIAFFSVICYWERPFIKTHTSSSNSCRIDPSIFFFNFTVKFTRRKSTGRDSPNAAKGWLWKSYGCIKFSPMSDHTYAPLTTITFT